MITVTCINGGRHHIAPAAIMDIRAPAPSEAWHGIQAVLRLTDGRVIEARETADQLMSALQEQTR
jgi:hypothetical protein